MSSNPDGVQQLLDKLATCQRELSQMRTRAVIAENARSLSLLGRSSEQELREDQLRIKLAEAEVTIDELRMRVLAAEDAVDALRDELLEERADR